MISIAIILALTAIFIAGLIVFWRKIVEWIKKATMKIQQVLGWLAEGTRTFIVKTVDGYKNKSRYYYKNKLTNELQEVEYVKEVDESEIPADILAKVHNTAYGKEVSTTEELKLAISA